MAYLLGIDISTTGAKAILQDEKGIVAASVTTEYPISTPKPKWSEQNPDDWWEGAVRSIRQALEKAQILGQDVVAIGLTGQMHGLVLLDGEGQVLRPAILWNDQRTGSQCAEIEERVGGLDRLLELTGNAVLPGFTAPKILWVRENEPEIYARAEKFLLPKDYVRFRLTGEYATEVSDASGTSLFDVGNRCWSDEMLSALDIPASWMPALGESPEVSGKISKAAAQATGLAPNTPVVGGGGDQAAQAVGSGIVRPGIISVTSGTSGVVFAHSEEYAAEPHGRLHAFCHAVPGRWHYMGVMLSAGGSLRWFRDQLCDSERAIAMLSGEDAYDLLGKEAARIPTGSDGLLFLPYLSGERTPYPDPEARGGFVGLTVRHEKPHLVRSVMEGVTFGLRDSLELVKGLGAPIEQVRASGGGARSSIWRQIQADVFNTELVLVNITEGAAFGAALLAGVGAGIYDSVEQAVDRTVHITSRTSPIAENAAVYERLYPLYRGLYPALRNTFHGLSNL